MRYETLPPPLLLAVPVPGTTRMFSIPCASCLRPMNRYYSELLIDRIHTCSNRCKSDAREAGLISNGGRKKTSWVDPETGITMRHCSGPCDEDLPETEFSTYASVARGKAVIRRVYRCKYCNADASWRYRHKEARSDS